MYSQFFGNYLLNEKLLTSEELLYALQRLKSKQAKLGALAVHFGYMTAEQVEEIYIAQTHEDKMFGDIALERNYLTKEQIQELISFQKPTYLTLGEVLIEEGLLTAEEFESALEKYKSTYSINDIDFKNEYKADHDSLIYQFYDSINPTENIFTMHYISLLITNIIRFIGKDFTPQEPVIYEEFNSETGSRQNIIGARHAFTAVDASREAFIQFARRYSGLEMTELDEYTKASVGDFLNLHNGLFAVNMSNEQSLELTLEAPEFLTNYHYRLHKSIFCIPIQFSFGIINFLFVDYES